MTNCTFRAGIFRPAKYTTNKQITLLKKRVTGRRKRLVANQIRKNFLSFGGPELEMQQVPIHRLTDNRATLALHQLEISFKKLLKRIRKKESGFIVLFILF